MAEDVCQILKGRWEKGRSRGCQFFPVFVSWVFGKSVVERCVMSFT